MMEIPMSSRDGMTLLTGGKFCPEDIRVERGEEATVTISRSAGNSGWYMTADIGQTGFATSAAAQPTGLRVGDVILVGLLKSKSSSASGSTAATISASGASYKSMYVTYTSGNYSYRYTFCLLTITSPTVTVKLS